MNRHAIAVLEFREAMGRVAARAQTDVGREALLERAPGTDPEAVREELARVHETLRVLEREPGWAPPPFPDVRRALRTLGLEGGVLDPPEVLNVHRLLSASRTLARDVEEAIRKSAPEDGGEPARLPHLAALRERLPRAPELERRLERVVDDEGEVRDGASPALSGLRRKLRSVRGKVVSTLERLLASLPERIRVEGQSVSVRDGRYVIPVRREGKGEVGGIVHGESATGATLFVEPPVAIRLMNEIHELEREEAREIQRILREVTGRLRPVRADLDDGFRAHVELDTLWARARTARAWEGHPPELLDADREEVEIVEGRHPLLLEQGVEVVPFFLALEADERAVVVSGPNTGGKTVLLKAVGLIHLLTQAGVVPPVGPGTRLPLVRDVFADIGDEQSIAESLSTFSAHLANAMEILAGAGPGTLVLMDEMGTGTDPSEGAALARAVLETLVERGCRALVTSHLGALKRLDGEGTGIVNASLLFDARELAPTYRFQKGRPGRSYGLAIARRLGLPEDVLERAEGYLDSGEVKAERLLERLEERERELARALREAETAREEAETLRAEAAARKAEVEERERSAEVRAREEARRVLLEARREVEEAIREVRGSGEADREEAETRARRRVEGAARRQRERASAASREPEPDRRLDPPVSEGERVRVRGSGARGVVRELRDDRVTVEVGGLRLQVSRAEVEPIREGAGEAGRSRAAGASGGWSGPEVDVRREADLRGLRVEEVELELGRALDGAVVGGLAELRIIHGKGTGAVKARVQELLRSDPRVEAFRSGGEGGGGAGVTVAHLA